MDMVADCMRGDHGFGVCLIQEGHEVGAVPSIYPVATLAYIIDWEQLPDGLLGITARGERKIRVREARAQSDLLLVGQVELLPKEEDVQLPQEFRPLRELLDHLLEKMGKGTRSPSRGLGRAGWIGARLSELLPLESSRKQELLAMSDPIVRLERLRELIKMMGSE